jgi:hypothetical protein
MLASDLRQPLFDERFKPLVSKHGFIGVAGKETWSELVEKPRRESENICKRSKAKQPAPIPYSNAR